MIVVGDMRRAASCQHQLRCSLRRHFMLQRAVQRQRQIQSACGSAGLLNDHYMVRSTDPGLTGKDAVFSCEGHRSNSAVQIQLPAIFRILVRSRLFKVQISQRHIRLAVHSKHLGINDLFCFGVASLRDQPAHLLQVPECFVVVRVAGETGP
ncbi:hypothetical protein D3C73_813800 [compost metagenome]